MTAPHDFTSIPPWAAYVWTDEKSIWLQLPCPVGKAPVLVEYPRTEAGFAKAVTLVEQCASIKRSAPSPGYYRHSTPPQAPPKLPKVKKTHKPSPLDNAPEGLMAALKKVLT